MNKHSLIEMMKGDGVSPVTLFGLAIFDLQNRIEDLENKVKQMDKKMKEVTAKMMTAGKAMKKHEPKAAMKSLHSAEKQNKKLTEIDRTKRDPKLKKCDAMMKMKKK